MPAIIISIILILAIKGLFNFDFLPAFIAYLAVKNSAEETISIGALCGFLEDALFYPGFLNFLSFTASSGAAAYFKRFFAQEDKIIILILALIITPVSILINAFGLKYFSELAYPDIILSMIRGTILNGLFVLVVNFTVWRDK